MLNMQVQGKMKGASEAQEEITEPHQGWHEKIVVQYGERHGAESKCVAHEEKCRPMGVCRHFRAIRP